MKCWSRRCLNWLVIAAALLLLAAFDSRRAVIWIEILLAKAKTTANSVQRCSECYPIFGSIFAHHNTERDGEKNVQRYGRGIAAYNFAVFLILFFVLHLVRCQRLENLRCQKTFLYKWITAELKMANTPTQLTHTLWGGMVKFEFARKCFIFVLFGRCLLYSMCDMVHLPGDHIFSFTC